MDNPFSIAEWGLSEMLNQPGMLIKAQEELNRIVGIDTLVQESHIPHLTYIRACARESLRLHPVAPFNLPHVSIADDIVAGYFIPKGSSVVLSRLGLGRNPKVWENPLKFDPERHLNGDASQQVELEEHELRFISFTTGRRGCMGGMLGTTITVMLFARLLQGFTWSMPPEVDKIDLTEAQTLFKLNPLHAHVKPRLPAAMYPI
ncbi:tryptophan N-monooxygenase CYP79A68-like isoform X2 [Argentina anserina]|uniref:tryptophan N-monooxygenase CYP79A68-like isoform X2 n=1 Tax=Argentina anserina TaxID=57926 RepID=UPI00217684C9|nr:tryptophan N-monooxygenase CYP79A68-like isoform X2 [Potentilla anserina]